MRLVNITENSVTLELEAADCLMLAQVLARGQSAIAGHLETGEIPLYAYAGAMLAACEAAGMAADVFMKQSNRDLAGWSLRSVREGYPELQLPGTVAGEGGRQ